MSRSDHSAAEFCSSPNYGSRRDGKTANMIILHYTGMDSGESALAWLRSGESQVSSHYLVLEDGHIAQLVKEDYRAWHAGKSVWQGECDINSCSIGIEIANCGHDQGLPPYPARQIQALIGLCQDIAQRHDVAPRRVLAHSDIAPGRKRDPGEHFPWRDLHRAGIGHWVEPVPFVGGHFLSTGDCGKPVQALQSLLALYGYGVEISGQYDETTHIVVEAFQRHFRPDLVDGVADQSTIMTLRNLLGTLPDVS